MFCRGFDRCHEFSAFLLTTVTRRARRRRVFIRRWTQINADKRHVWICLGILSAFICVYLRILLCILCVLRVSVVNYSYPPSTGECTADWSTFQESKQHFCRFGVNRAP